MGLPWCLCDNYLLKVCANTNVRYLLTYLIRLGTIHECGVLLIVAASCRQVEYTK